MLIGDKKMKKLAIILAFGLASCGGGGGGGSGSDFRFLGGVYSGNGLVLIDTCNAIASSAFSFTYTVNQDDTRIILTGSNGTNYEGQPTSDNSFTVGNNVVNGNCTSETQIQVTEITDSSAEITSAILTKCGALSCSIGTRATAERVS